MGDCQIHCSHARSFQWLGGGFAGYGIYPQYKDYYAFHIFYDSLDAKHECEMFLERHFDIADLSKIPVRKNKNITDEPMIWRYFVIPLQSKLVESQLEEENFTRRCVLHINDKIKGANVFSSGKNMGCFKAIGFPKMSAISSAWKNMKAIAGPRTAVIRPIRPAGGAAPIRLIF